MRGVARKENSDMVIGIIGGMGPDASNELCRLITALTPAHRDQEHIPVICYSNPKIPSRLDALNGKGPSPVPELVRTARILQQAGASFLIMPCNIAHYFLDDIRSAVDIPILNMIEETANHIATAHPAIRKVGILASTPAIELGIYQQNLSQHGITLIRPASEQQDIVMDCIYGQSGVKAGKKAKPRMLLTEVGNSLISTGADAIIAGCTEVSVALPRKRSPFPLIDALEVIARVAVEKACAVYV